MVQRKISGCSIDENQSANELKEGICQRCSGTGMVCGHEPEILPGACCVDFANAVCPVCGGTGRVPRNERGKNSFSKEG